MQAGQLGRGGGGDGRRVDEQDRSALGAGRRRPGEGIGEVETSRHVGDGHPGGEGCGADRGRGGVAVVPGQTGRSNRGPRADHAVGQEVRVADDRAVVATGWRLRIHDSGVQRTPERREGDLVAVVVRLAAPQTED